MNSDGATEKSAQHPRPGGEEDPVRISDPSAGPVDVVSISIRVLKKRGDVTSIDGLGPRPWHTAPGVDQSRISHFAPRQREISIHPR